MTFSSEFPCATRQRSPISPGPNRGMEQSAISLAIPPFGSLLYPLAAGNILLTPVSGDQVACGEWVELDEEQVHSYCELLAQCLNNNKLNDKELSK